VRKLTLANKENVDNIAAGKQFLFYLNMAKMTFFMKINLIKT